MGISHVVGHHAVTGRTYSTNEIAIGNGATETSCSIGVGSMVRVSFNAQGMGISILSMGRAVRGRSTTLVCGVVRWPGRPLGVFLENIVF